MREEITLRLRGSWERAVRPDAAELRAVLAPFDAELVDVPLSWPGEFSLVIVASEATDLFAVGAAVADVLALPSPRITFHVEADVSRGAHDTDGQRASDSDYDGSAPGGVVHAAGGRGYFCSCGGVDGDHAEGCPKATA